jgi:hypothetical protein
VAGGTKAASQQKPTTSYAEAADFISNIAARTKESANDVVVTTEQLEVALIPSNNGPGSCDLNLFYQNAKGLRTKGYDFFDSECWP